MIVAEFERWLMNLILADGAWNRVAVLVLWQRWYGWILNCLCWIHDLQICGFGAQVNQDELRSNRRYH